MSSSGNDRYAFRGGLNPEKRKQDLAASFPKVGRCLKCFKHLIIDPEARCTIEPGKKNCARCTKGGGKCELVSSSSSHVSYAFPYSLFFENKADAVHKIPRSCAEACRAWEEKIDAFAAWLAANPSQHVANPDDPQDWVFEDWLDSYKLKDSSRRIKDAQDDETWEGVPGVSSPWILNSLS